ncbi:MAG: Tol-Pal system protein TolB [Campylobacterota bacterium]|nr:Tol-Pal system protein TolB [Campylobacterota bacterium]
MINRILVLSIVLFNSLYAIDATMEIIKKKSNLPFITVKTTADSYRLNGIDTKISSLVKKDLLVSGHFNNKEVVSNKSFDQLPDFTMMSQYGIDLKLVLQVKLNQINGIEVNTKLYDINTQQMILSKSYSTSSKSRYPFLSHKIAIDVNKALNAPSIDWMDKFIIFARYLSSRKSEIVISDYTLTYQKVVVKGGLNIFPKWADQKQESFYYTSYNYTKPTLIKKNLYTGERQKILSSDGMMVCSDVNSDGTKLVLTMAPNSQPDIYVYDVKTQVKTRITKYSGIDVGGSFVENDTKVVFISDRLKYPNIFAKGIGKKGIERLVYHGKNNSQCTTYGDYIVYSSRETDNEFSNNSFNLYLISTQSDFVRRLTTYGRNQFPKFSNDGESVLFIKNADGQSSLGIIRLNYNKSFIFPLKSGRLQSIDW